MREKLYILDFGFIFYRNFDIFFPCSFRTPSFNLSKKRDTGGYLGIYTGQKVISLDITNETFNSSKYMY